LPWPVAESPASYRVFHCPWCEQAVNLDSTKCAARVRARAAFEVTVAGGVLAALIAPAGARTFSRAGR
jgi:hypothetical protein